jgi:hypothetical protein
MQGGGGLIYLHNQRADGTARWWHVHVGNGIARRSGRVGVCSCGAETTGAVKGTRGVGILSVRRRRGGELDREGAGRGHTARMGMPAHGAYMHLGSRAVT